MIWKFTLACVMGVVALGVLGEQAPCEWTIRNDDLAVTIMRDGGRFSVCDRHTLQTWTAFARDDTRFVVQRVTYKDVDTLDVELVYDQTGGTFRATWHLEGMELLVTLDAHAGALAAKEWNYPATLAAERGDYLIAPIGGEGLRIPFLEDIGRVVWYPKAWNSSLAMPFFGVERGRDGSGWCAILETPDDAAMRTVNTRNELERVGPVWMSSHGKFAYARRVRYIFQRAGGYVAMAKRYRAYAAKTGLLKTFAEKEKMRPNVARLLGAANVWYYPTYSHRDPAPSVVARELQESGIQRILWSHDAHSNDVQVIAKMPDVLVGRYDCYRDVYRPDQLRAMGKRVPPIEEECCMNTSAWPNDCIWTTPHSNDWRKAWGVRAKSGEKVYCATQCAINVKPRVRRNVAHDLKTKPFTARFIDVTTAVGGEECENPAHPTTRKQSWRAKFEMLDMLGREFGFVVGSEQGMGAAVPVCDYFEGMLSPFWARMPHGRPGSSRYDIFRDPLCPTNVTPQELSVAERFGLGPDIRIPLFELVFHDCACAHWYWYDYSNRPLFLWAKRDLFNALYGTMPMFVFDYKHWRDFRTQFVESYALTSPIAQATGHSEMLDHRAITADRLVQLSRFADGTSVLVNFGEAPYALPDGRALQPYGVLASGPKVDFMRSARHSFADTPAVVQERKWKPIGKRKARVVLWGIVHNHASGKFDALNLLTNDYEIVGWVDDSASKAMRMRDPNPKHYAKWPKLDGDKVLREIKPDLIVVEVSNSELVEVSTKIALAGYPMHMDKPLGVDLAGFRRMSEICERRNIPLQIGYMFRSNEAINKMVELAKSGVLGEVYAVDADLDHCYGYPKYPAYASHYPGGTAYLLTCHAIEWAMPVFKDALPLRTYSIIKPAPGDPAWAKTHSLTIMEYPQANCTFRVCSRGTQPCRHIRIDGSNGSMALKPVEDFRKVKHTTGLPEDGLPKVEDLVVHLYLKRDSGAYKQGYSQLKFKAPQDRYAGQLQELARILRGEIPNPPGLYEHDRKVHKVSLDACYRHHE